MAVTQNTLIGRTRNSIGGVTFSTWKGLNVAKSKPISVANPQTLPQRQQRARLSFMVALFRLLNSTIQIGFRTLAINKSQYNAFVSENIQDAVSVDGSAVASLIPNLFVTAKGTIATVAISSITAAAGDNEIQVDFPTTIPVGGAAGDKCYLVVYNETKDSWGINSNDEVRNDGQCFGYPSEDQAIGDIIHVWLFFASENDNNVSDSVYSTLTVS